MCVDGCSCVYVCMNMRERDKEYVPPPFEATFACKGEGDFRTLITDAFEGLLFVVLLKCAPIEEAEDPDVVDTGVTGGP